MGEAKKYMYLYRVTDPITRFVYYGSRISKVPPLEDIKYMGSMVKWKPDKSKLIKDIILEMPEGSTKEDLREAEAELISITIGTYISQNYHIPNKGFYCKCHTEETKEKIRQKSLLYRHTEETKAKMAESRKYVVITQEWKDNMSRAGKGRIFSQEHKNKISEKLTNRIVSDKTKELISKSRKMKPILQYDLDNNFIKEWENAYYPTKEITGRRGNSLIFKCCNGRAKTAYGFIWRYKNMEATI